MRRIVTFGILINLILVFSVIVAVTAQESSPTAEPTPSDDDVNRVAKNLYCPVCPNTPLDVCETQACADWRYDIRLKLSQGWSDQQIFDYFVERHGDRVLTSPPLRGLNWLVYIVPPLAILGGAIILIRTLRNSLGKPAAELPGKNNVSSPLEDNEYAARLEEELENRQ